MIDFIDDIFDILKFTEGSAITESDAFIKSNQIPGEYNRIPSFSNQFIGMWESGWNLLKKQLLRTNKLERVLINRVYLSNRDDDGNIFEYQHYINKANYYLESIYGKLESDLRTNQFINYQDMEFVAASGHILGKAPYHYTTQVYSRCKTSTKDFLPCFFNTISRPE